MGLVTRKMIKSLSRAPLKQPLCPASSAHHRLMRGWLAPLSLSFVTSSLEEIKRSPTGALGPACVCSERLNSLRPPAIRNFNTASRPVQQDDVEVLRGDNRTTLGLMPLELMLPSLHHFSNLGDATRSSECSRHAHRFLKRTTRV